METAAAHDGEASALTRRFRDAYAKARRSVAGKRRRHGGVAVAAAAAPGAAAASACVPGTRAAARRSGGAKSGYGHDRSGGGGGVVAGYDVAAGGRARVVVAAAVEEDAVGALLYDTERGRGPRNGGDAPPRRVPHAGVGAADPRDDDAGARASAPAGRPRRPASAGGAARDARAAAREAALTAVYVMPFAQQQQQHAAGRGRVGALPPAPGTRGGAATGGYLLPDVRVAAPPVPVAVAVRGLPVAGMHAYHVRAGAGGDVVALPGTASLARAPWPHVPSLDPRGAVLPRRGVADERLAVPPPREHGPAVGDGGGETPRDDVGYARCDACTQPRPRCASRVAVRFRSAASPCGPLAPAPP